MFSYKKIDITLKEKLSILLKSDHFNNNNVNIQLIAERQTSESEFSIDIKF